MHTDRFYVAEAMQLLVPNSEDYLNILWAVEEFNKKFNVTPNADLYANLVIEEVNEWQEELLLHGATPNLLKETADVLYVLEGLLAANTEDRLNISQKADIRLGGALAYIMDVMSNFVDQYYSRELLMAAFNETHRSNMSKLGEDGKPVYRESDNKVLKGPNYSPANMENLWSAETTYKLKRF